MHFSQATRFATGRAHKVNGLALKPNVVNILLGATILFIVVIMGTAKKSDFPKVPKPDNLSQSLHIMGIYREESLGKDVSYDRTSGVLCYLYHVVGVCNILYI